MRKLMLLAAALSLTGCVTLPNKIVDWKDNNNQVVFENGQTAHILGNPRITCYTYPNHLVWADGYFMYIGDDDFMVVDEFGKDTVWLHPYWGYANYCVLGKGD